MKRNFFLRFFIYLRENMRESTEGQGEGEADFWLSKEPESRG